MNLGFWPGENEDAGNMMSGEPPFESTGSSARIEGHTDVGGSGCRQQQVNQDDWSVVAQGRAELTVLEDSWH